MAVTYGPRHIFTYWEPLTESNLRGPVENQAYFAFQDNISLSRVVNTEYMYNSLSPEISYELGILVNNGVLNSTTLSTVINSTFSLPPRPVLKEGELKNTSLVAMVTLNQNDSAVLTNVGMFIQVRLSIYLSFYPSGVSIHSFIHPFIHPSIYSFLINSNMADQTQCNLVTINHMIYFHYNFQSLLNLISLD